MCATDWVYVLLILCVCVHMYRTCILYNRQSPPDPHTSTVQAAVTATLSKSKEGLSSGNRG